jgi:Fe-S cluster assembly protein SufD
MNVLPHRKIEDWKYSDLRSAVDENIVASAPAAAWSAVSLSGAVDIADLPAIMPRGEHGAMADIAIASAKAGPCVRLTKDEVGAVHLALTEGGHGRALIVVEDGASLTLQETVQAEDFANIAIEIIVGENAKLTHIRHAPRNDAVQVADYSVRVAAGGTYRAQFANFGGKLSRTELHIALAGEGAEAHLSGVGVLNDGHADMTTHMTHASGKTQSKQLFKYVASGHARGVYQGKVTVAAGANGSDSNQSAKGLLLGNRAEIDLKPELEILADDVKCAHGAAIGDLDIESLFYLRSRGIPEAEARALLIRAFIGDAVEQIEDETIRATIWQAVDTALETLA